MNRESINKLIICADSRDIGDLFPEQKKSFRCCVTSPPYYNLRDYGVEGQIGDEKDVDTYIDELVKIFRGVRDLLSDDGTLWIVIGDGYSGHNRGGKRYKQKDMYCVPWLLGLALQKDGWYLRQDIIWEKPNCMPESVKDRFTKCHEYVLLLSKSPVYYFDADALAVPSVSFERTKGRSDGTKETADRNDNGSERYLTDKYNFETDRKIRPKSKSVYDYKPMRKMRDVWKVSTRPHKGVHTAAFPVELAEMCIKAGSAEGDAVLDPFVGSGTTGVAALGLGRRFTGVEINPEYADMAIRRIIKENG